MCEVYGRSEDPWPYEYVINSLLFFSMSIESRNQYLSNDCSRVLFHGNGGDWHATSAFDTTVAIYTEILGAGKTIDEWLEDEALNYDVLITTFKSLQQKLYRITTQKSVESFDIHWEEIQTLSQSLLALLSLSPIREEDTMPFMTCVQLLDEYSYGAYSASFK